MAAGTATLMLDTSADQEVGEFSIRETWQVITTVATDGTAEVLAAPSLPFLGQGYTGDPSARVVKRRPRRMDDLFHWQVDVDYEYQKESSEDKQNPPTLRPVVRAASTRWVEKALVKDRNGKMIATKATNTPFNPPITISIPHPVVTFTRWENSFSTSTQKLYVGKVNSAQFGAYGPGVVMCTDISAAEEWEQNALGQLQRYWQVTYEFEAAPNGDNDKFDPIRILNQDVYFIDIVGGNNVRVPIYIDSAGNIGNVADLEADAIPVPYPIPIDDTGNVVNVDDLPDAAYFNEFNIYETANFNNLQLPVD